jgi:subtilisin family serine protease
MHIADRPAALLAAASIASAVSVASVTPSAIAQQAAQDQYVPGEFIVLTDAAPRALTAASVELSRAGFIVAEADARAGALLVHADPADPNAQRAIALTPGVRHVERNGIGSGGLMPNDSFFAAQWHLHNTGQNAGKPGADVAAAAAWAISTGSPNVTIAVLDSGSDFAHPDFAGRFLPGGFDFVAEDADAEGDHPHGTWVAGVIAANANNGFAVTGIDHAARILTVKVLNDNNAGTTFDQIQGVNYAASVPEVDIINLSLINYPSSVALDQAMADARAAGKIVIACAGNGGPGNADNSWPGASTNSISIGATDRNDNRAGFSATGAALDFVAPGSFITTTEWQTTANVSRSVSGCSFATPLTSGIAGLLLARAEELGFTLNHDDVYRLFKAGAEDLVGPASEDAPGRDDYFGWGRLNALHSLELVADCNQNGTLDLTDIALGNSADIDNDNIPDECAGCPGDATGDGTVGTADLLVVLSNWAQPTAGGPEEGDLDASGDVGTADLLIVLSAWDTAC